MRRRLSNALAALSLLLCLGLAGLWVRSHFVRDWFHFHRVANGEPLQRDRGEMITYPGVLKLTLYRTVYPPPEVPGFRQRLERDDGWFWDTLAALKPWEPSPPTRARRLGFVYQHLPQQGTDLGAPATTTVAAPLWAPVAASSLPPLAWLARRLRRARLSSRGLCESCGYDLRASPERCPECGKAVKGGAADA